jgi:hypothetical protein
MCRAVKRFELLSMAAHVCNPSPQEAEVGGSQVEASLGYIERLSPKKKTTTITKTFTERLELSNLLVFVPVEADSPTSCFSSQNTMKCCFQRLHNAVLFSFLCSL